MMWSLIVVFTLSLLASSLIGHAIHWALHQRWTGPGWRGHMQHHLELYPPGDLTSVHYRTASWFNSGTFLFTPPLVIIIAAMNVVALFAGVSLWYVIVASIAFVGFGVVNDLIHDNLHIEGSWIARFAWYRRLQHMHFVHHRHMRRNYGIVTFVWDRLFRTLRSSE